MKRARRVIAAVSPVVSRIGEHQLSHHAAAMTYYALLSLFPALLIGVALLGLLGSEAAIEDVAGYVADRGAPSATVEAVRSMVDTAVSARARSSVAVLVLALVVALYGSSGWLSAAGKGLDAVAGPDDEDGPSFVRRKAIAIAATVGLIALGLLALVLVFLGGGLAEDALGAVGLGGAAGAWQWLRWPAAFAVAVVGYGVVYSTAPAYPRSFRPITPGAAVGVGLWLAASAAFFVFVGRFGNYNATYGVFAGFVVLLVWLWLTNLTVLLGAEVDRELARSGRDSGLQHAPGELVVVRAQRDPAGAGGAEPEMRLRGNGEAAAERPGGEPG